VVVVMMLMMMRRRSSSYDVHVLPESNISHYRLDDPNADLNRPKELVFMRRYRDFNQRKSILASSSRARMQVTYDVYCPSCIQLCL
jgi:hypothetical protein